MKTEKYIFVDVLPESQVHSNGDRSAFPEKLEPGIVYCCKEYSHSVHLCPCGCGDIVNIPFKEEHEKESFWGLKGSTFTPSILKKFGCLSHYQIINGVVVW